MAELKQTNSNYCNEKEKISVNFLSKYRNKDLSSLNKFTATQFLEVWNNFDSDGNGYIEEHELDGFLIQLVTCAIEDPIGQEVISKAAYEDMKKEFLEAYDDNNDGRIEIGELAQILPTDEEFLVLFQRETPLQSSVEFMKIWKKFDQDCSGFIESDELSSFIRYLLLNANKQPENIDQVIEHYTGVMLTLFDRNGDGKLQLSEMARLLPIKENFIAKPMFNNTNKISYVELDRIFKVYDEDSNGQMENHELQALLKDILELCDEKYDTKTLEHFQEIILTEWDVNHDGKISKKELKMILTQHTKLEEVKDTNCVFIKMKEDIKNVMNN